MPIVQVIVACLSVVFLGGLLVYVLRGQDAKIERIETRQEQQVIPEVCQQKHEELEKRLDKGDQKFSKVEEKISSMNNILIRVDTRLGLLIEKEGIER